MHIPDGYISPQTAGSMWAFMVPAWYWAGYKVKKALNARQAPLVAIGAAFAFVIMMFNVPLPGGTTGHAVGGTIVALVIGPWAAVIAISVALIIQAVFFGDGGILAIGANCFNIGFILPITGYTTYRLLSRGAAEGSARRWIAAGIAAYVGINIAALFTAVEFGLQAELFTAGDGSALYAPYGLSTAIPAMMGPHLLVVGLIEAVTTSLIYMFLAKTNSALLGNYAEIKAAAAGSFKLKPLVIGIVLMLIFTPLGLLATSTAWGEWGADEINEKIGYLPGGMERFSDTWKGLLPDYAFPKKEEAAGVGNGTPAAANEAVITEAQDNAPEAEEPVLSLSNLWESTPAYLISGVLGLLFVGGVTLGAVKLLTRGSRNRGEQLG